MQNGANAVYFGANKFNARINGTNFSNDDLKKAIEYAKLRNVKTYLTLNTLIKNNEFEESVKLLEYAYECGIDGIIMQDLGLAKFAIEHFPDLEIHASTQMTAHNVEGVKKLKELGFKRVVLSRELNLKEIKEIYDETKMDLEMFIHGALCISYSGQCLMSSIIGQRSGNRGKCAGTCRLPYELVNKEDNKTIDKGYLLSSKDVCTLDIIPEIIKSGAMSFKIEGRMKTPEYVGVVTSIYRKYIDLALSENEYKVDEEDRKKLMQVFNRGGFSTGYINGKLGKKMMYTKRPNHMGVPLGKVMSYNPNRGYVKVKLEDNIDLGDSIRINESSCKTSELMKNKNNIKTASIGEMVTLGRIKGKINVGDLIYKTVSQKLESEINQISSKENIKRKVKVVVNVKIGQPIDFEILDIQTKKSFHIKGNIAQTAQKLGTDKQRIEEQIRKTGGTIFEVQEVEINMEENAFVPIKEINELRRCAIEGLEEALKSLIGRKPRTLQIDDLETNEKQEKTKVALLLNLINENFDYKNLHKVDRVYLPISEVFLAKNKEKVKEITASQSAYLYMPNIIRDEHKQIIYKKVQEVVENYNIKGFVVSNLSQIEELKKYKLELIGNYTLNVFNNRTAKELENLDLGVITISPELNENEIKNIKTNVEKEFIVYGRTQLMTSEYCTIGTFYNCSGMCAKGKYVLKDRMNFEFPIYTNRINCNTTIYNSKITSITWKNLKLDSIRIDILDENIEDINKIIEIHKQNERLEGQNYTNGNLKKEI